MNAGGPDNVAAVDETEPLPDAEALEQPETGDARVDEVLRGLSALDELPTSEHVAVFDEVQRGLQDALANLDTTPQQ